MLFNVRASEMAQICLVFITVFAYKDTKKYPFQKIHLLAELVLFFNIMVQRTANENAAGNDMMLSATT